MIIREAGTEDLERILEIYEIAKAFMRQTGTHISGTVVILIQKH